MAFAIKGEGAKKNNLDAYNSGNYRGQKKDRMFCTHCNYLGHTIEKCYKLHGYPPGYKSNAARSKSTNAVMAQVSISDDSSQSHNAGFFNTLSSEQYQQLMTMLSNHLVSNQTDDHSDNPSKS